MSMWFPLGNLLIYFLNILLLLVIGFGILVMAALVIATFGFFVKQFSGQNPPKK